MNYVILDDGSAAIVIVGVVAVGCAVMAKVFGSADIVRGIIAEVL